jgi:hypothetical protein
MALFLIMLVVPPALAIAALVYVGRALRTDFEHRRWIWGIVGTLTLIGTLGAAWIFEVEFLRAISQF